MKLGARPDTVLEWLAVKLNLAPKPLADTHLSFQFARIIMAAAKCGIFEALKTQGHTAAEVAAISGANQAATQKVLDALLAHGYLSYRAPHYELNKLSRKWLLAESPSTLVHKLDFQDVEWRWTESFDTWLRDGSVREMHGALSQDEWRRYQWAMRDVAATGAPEVACRAPVPRYAKTLLDIGGSHGFHSVELCRNYPALTATVLELPDAIPTAADILAREKMGARVSHMAGNALEHELGEGVYDVVLMAAVVHHFTNQQNQSLAERVARSLKPHGVFMIVDAVRIEGPEEAQLPNRRIGAIFDVYFAMTSASGTWSINEIQSWQRAAGLRTRRPIWLRTMPGAAIVSAARPA
jgi:2-polyprenyl-3-methyl-5-hydroxy-6-metoxy-1,4-benzoquinol methylase